jgi:hypothetical protein
MQRFSLTPNGPEVSRRKNLRRDSERFQMIVEAVGSEACRISYVNFFLVMYA